MFRTRPRLNARARDLTARQEEVLALLARGKTNYEIAQALGVSLEGAKYHVREILARLEVGTREEAAALWGQERRGPPRRLQGVAGTVAAKSLVAGAAGLVGVAAIVVVVVAVVTSGTERPAGGDDSGGPGATVPITALQTSTVAVGSTPALPPAGPYPLGTRTGQASVDRVVEAVESGDANALFSLIHYTGLACAGERPQPVPPHTFRCPNGEPDGTLIPVVLANPGVFAQGDPAVPVLVRDFLSPKEPFDARLWAVASDFGERIAGQWLIVFNSGQSLVVDDTGISQFRGSNFRSQPAFDDPNLHGYLLPPRNGNREVFAFRGREFLFETASSAALVDDPGAGYGLIPNWSAANPKLAIVDSAKSAGGSEVSVRAEPLDPALPPDNRTNPRMVYFAAGDTAGNCAGGYVRVDITNDPRGGFATFAPLAVPLGEPCTADVVRAELRKQ